MMGKTNRLIAAFILVSSAVLAQEFTAGALAGSAAGPGVEVQATAAKFAEGFPFILRFAAGYYSLDPGNPQDARIIFINDATNGTPEKSGHFLSVRLDFLYRINWFGWNRFYLYGGPRHSYFTGNFKYIGGNEDFDVTCKSWGAGLGLEKLYAINPSLDLVLTAGCDYFKKSTLSGHDTQYAPNGEIVNGRKEYTYDDANKAIKQPEIVPRLLIGAAYRF
jgi:hypothetical protein